LKRLPRPTQSNVTGTQFLVDNLVDIRLNSIVTKIIPNSRTDSASDENVALFPGLLAAAKTVVSRHKALESLGTCFNDAPVVLTFKDEAQSIRAEHLLSEIIAASNLDLVSEALKDFKYCYVLASCGIRRVNIQNYYDGDLPCSDDRGVRPPAEPTRLEKLQLLRNHLRSCGQLMKDLKDGYLDLKVEVKEKNNLKSLGKVATAWVALNHIFINISTFLAEYSRSDFLQFHAPAHQHRNIPVVFVPTTVKGPKKTKLHQILIKAEYITDNRLVDICNEISCLKNTTSEWSISEGDLELAARCDQSFNHCGLVSCVLFKDQDDAWPRAEDPNYSKEMHLSNVAFKQKDYVIRNRCIRKLFWAQQEFLRLLPRPKLTPEPLKGSITAEAQPVVTAITTPAINLSTLTKVASGEAAPVQKGKSFLVDITAINEVRLNGKLVSEKAAKILCALACLADNWERPLISFNPEAFFKLLKSSPFKTHKLWYDYKKALKKLKINVKGRKPTCTVSDLKIKGSNKSITQESLKRDMDKCKAA